MARRRRRQYYICFAASIIAGKFAETFKDFPPIQRPNSFTIDDAIKAMAAVDSTTADMLTGSLVRGLRTRDP